MIRSIADFLSIWKYETCIICTTLSQSHKFVLALKRTREVIDSLDTVFNDFGQSKYLAYFECFDRRFFDVFFVQIHSFTRTAREIF